MKELLKIILTCRIRTHVRSHEQPLTLPACSITSCNPDAMWLPSVMLSLGYKSFLSKSRHTAVCTMHLRPWCLKTSSSVRQGHWGVHKCHHSQTCQGRELTSQPGLTPWKQCSDIVCLQLQIFPGHRHLWVHRLTTPTSPRMRCSTYSTRGGRGETAPLLSHLRSVWAQGLELQPPPYSRPPCIPRLGHVFGLTVLCIF